MWRGISWPFLITLLIEHSQGWGSLPTPWMPPSEKPAPTPHSVLCNERVTFKCPLLGIKSRDKGRAPTQKRLRVLKGQREFVHVYKSFHTYTVKQNN